jgi:hypothetical protein
VLPLDDPKWKLLAGGYRTAYDASAALSRFERGANVWGELWNELHHQGDVGEASYAAVPHLVRIAALAKSRDFNMWSLISTIEIERHRKSNPPLPEWLRESYALAWANALRLAARDVADATDTDTVQALLGVIAIAKGSLKLGALISHLDASELNEIVEEYYAWSELYA